MAPGNRIGMLQVFVVLTLFCCTCQSASVTSPLRGNANQGRSSGFAGSCVPLFDVKYPRFNSGGATPQLTTKNEEDCKNACVADMRCVSYQIDTNPDHTLCWLQLNKEKLALDNMLDIKSVTEYILVSRCGDPGASQLTIEHDLCFPVFENKNPGWVSRMAANAPEAKTEDECKAACVTIPACVSYQVERKSGGIICWLQYNEKKLIKDQMYQSATITEYVIVDRCPKLPEANQLTTERGLCFPVFENKNPGWVSRNAANALEAKTEDECKAACVTIPACVSYQIEKTSGGILCWLQHNDQKLIKDQMYQSATITEYVLVSRCSKFPEPVMTSVSPDVCVPVFENKNPGWVSRHATNTPEAKTEEQCKDACVRNPGCVSYQIELKFGYVLCRLQYNEQKLTKNQMCQCERIKEYILVDRCQMSTETIEKECYVTMKPSMFGQLSANAIIHEAAKEERTCVAACIAKIDCISVQFKYSEKNWLCFLQHDFNAFKPENLMYQPNVTEYVITKKCEDKNACSRGFPLKRMGGPIYFRKRRSLGCEVIIQPVNNGMSTAKAVPLQKKLTWAEDCIAACVADKGCISTQHKRHPSNGSFAACSLQFDARAFLPTKLLYRPNVREYIIKKRCSEIDRCSKLI